MSRFEKWCALAGHCALPASPMIVASFLHENGDLSPDLLWAEIAELDHRMESLGYAPAGRSTVALRAFSNVAKVEMPRSWPRDAGALWELLPYGIQVILARRESERDKALNRAMNEAADLRKKLEKYDGDTQTEAA